MSTSRWDGSHLKGKYPMALDATFSNLKTIDKYGPRRHNGIKQPDNLKIARHKYGVLHCSTQHLLHT